MTTSGTSPIRSVHMHDMTVEEMQAFITQGTRTGHLATVRAAARTWRRSGS
jgi:hypothetical protein